MLLERTLVYISSLGLVSSGVTARQMTLDYYGRLPADIRLLVDRVEDAAGIDIAVAVDPEREDSMGVYIEETGATISIPNIEYFPDGAVLHEVLHIRRLLCEGIPRIVDNIRYASWKPETHAALRDLDNNLEHLVIVPEELRLSRLLK